MAMLAVHPACGGKPPQSQHPKGAVMDSSTAKPFGLSEQDQGKVKIFLALHSPKTGAGKQRIEIEGNGDLRLVRSANREAPEETVSGKVKPNEVTALLIMLENEGLLGMELEYKGKTMYSMRRQISLTLPSGEKSVYADHDVAPPAFERMAGAIQLLAGMGTPQALNHRFLAGL
jgi:hypothetical protein